MEDKKEQHSSQKINFHSTATQSSHRARTECIKLCVNIQSSKTVQIHIVLIIFNTNSSHHHICYRVKKKSETLECQIYGNHWTYHITLCQKKLFFHLQCLNSIYCFFCCSHFDIKLYAVSIQQQKLEFLLRSSLTSMIKITKRSD